MCNVVDEHKGLVLMGLFVAVTGLSALPVSSGAVPPCEHCPGGNPADVGWTPTSRSRSHGEPPAGACSGSGLHSERGDLIPTASGDLAHSGVDAVGEASGDACVRVRKVNDDHEPLSGWAIHARPSGVPGPDLEETTDASGWVTFSLEADQYWTFWEEMQIGWEPVTESELERWVPETLTDCMEAQFMNRLLLPYDLYVPIAVRGAPGAP